VEGDAGDVGAGDCEGEEGQGGALRVEEEEPEDGWFSAELIGGEIAFEGAGLLSMKRGELRHVDCWRNR
jgi:hypothetical protein